MVSTNLKIWKTVKLHHFPRIRLKFKPPPSCLTRSCPPWSMFLRCWPTQRIVSGSHFGPFIPLHFLSWALFSLLLSCILKRYHFKGWAPFSGNNATISSSHKGHPRLFFIKFQEFMTTCLTVTHEPPQIRNLLQEVVFSWQKSRQWTQLRLAQGWLHLASPPGTSLQEECWKTESSKNQSNSNASHKLHQMGLHSCLLSCCLFLPFQTSLTWP